MFDELDLKIDDATSTSLQVPPSTSLVVCPTLSSVCIITHIIVKTKCVN